MESGLEEITEAELIKMAIEDKLIDLHVAFPARVESYDADKQTVEVTPQLYRHLSDGSDNFLPEALPALKDVPVCFPRCGGFFVSFPLQAGDFVLVVCCQKNIGAWRSTGSAGDPGDVGTHTLDGAVAIPGVFPDGKAISNAGGNNMKLGSDSDAKGRIVIKSNEIDLGENANDFVALAAKVKAWFDAFNSAVTGWTPVPNDGGAALKAALGSLIAGTPSTNVASDNAKAHG